MEEQQSYWNYLYRASAIMLLIYLTFSLIHNIDRNYEYQIVSYGDEDVIDALDKLGRDGWQVISARRAIDDSDNNVYEFIMMKEE